VVDRLSISMILRNRRDLTGLKILICAEDMMMYSAGIAKLFGRHVSGIETK
jgi:hypothetical protein